MRYFYVILLSILAFNTQAKVHSSDSNFWYVDNFYQTAKNASNLLQKNTGRNYSCGLTSALFVNNYFSVENTGISPAFIDSVSQSTAAIDRLYDYIQVDKNDENGTSVYDAQDIALNRWNWQIARIASGGNQNLKINFDGAAKWIKNDYPLLIALTGNFHRNPVKPWRHVVILFAYKKDPNGNSQNDILYWFDPYYGEISGFYRSEASIAIQGYASSFLRVAP